MNSPSGSASLGLAWSTNEKETSSLLLDTARLGGIGAISLGFSVQAITDFYTSTNPNGASLYIATPTDMDKVPMRGLKEANIKIDGSKALVYNSYQDYVGEISCKPNNVDVTNVSGTTIDFGETSFIFYCSEINIAMVPVVYVLAVPNKGLVISMVHKHVNVALVLLCVMLVAMAISVLVFVAMLVRATRREVHLCAAYMREMEKTAQAERKSMKQSLAFASANHDVRGYLACMKGLIDLSIADLPSSSEIAFNLRKMDTCAEDLLDFSKIEAGKMQLEDKDFNLSQLLEDIADLYHPVAMKKMVEVILDPCDGSIFKYSHVRGDRAKLKQVLGNLLSNAVKFTSQGHICIRCHVKKPSLENIIIASNRNNLLNRISRYFYKNKRTYNDLEEMKRIQQDPSCLEFEFEVEDSGVGIPIDKRHSIFEDFVQVKENSAGQVGTGLGLGIVQSLVRLMGGDIEIVDKRNGEQGTCFKFNIFLLVQEEGSPPLDSSRQAITEHIDVANPSIGLSTCIRSPRSEKSLVIVLIKNEVRRLMVHRYMESLGINLKVLSQVKQLYSILKRIKSKLIEPPQSNNNSSSSGRLDSPRAMYLSSSSDCCRGGHKLLPLNLMEGSDDVLPVYKRPKIRGSIKCILLILDCNVGDNFHKLQRSVSEFRKDLYMTCIKVVWLDRLDTHKDHFKGLDDVCLPSTDHIMLDPLHGSRLLRVIQLLPEFGGDYIKSPNTLDGKRSHTSNINTAIQTINAQSETNEEFVEQENPHILGSSSSDKSMSRDNTTHVGETQEITNADAIRVSEMRKLPLEGKRILVVDDQVLPRMLAEKCVARLGAETQTCENGKEALEVMDVMDGFEATKRIRKEERKYGVHILIIALTAHEVDGEEGKRIFEAGMDFHLTKPLQPKNLLSI
ncbi:Histidine kinase CKI1, partial [Bienertia sinuspersici]